jgi:uncharacterized protein (TIGR02271 family)
MNQAGQAHVSGRDGLRGTVLRRVGEHAEIELDDSAQRLLIPFDLLRLLRDGNYEMPLGTADLPPPMPTDDRAKTTDVSTVVPVVQEELRIDKEQQETAQVVVHITPHVKHEVVRAPLQRETVEVERIPVNRRVDTPLPVRQEGDVTVVPVFEEILVVEKQLVLKEEIRIKRHRTVEHQVHEVALRQEDARVL